MTPSAPKFTVGTKVRQARADAGYEKHIGRVATIVYAFDDEKGQQQCETDDGMWCPVRHLDEAA